MKKYLGITLKTDPELTLGVKTMAPGVLNKQTIKSLSKSKKQIEKGNIYQFKTTEQALQFLADELMI